MVTGATGGSLTAQTIGMLVATTGYTRGNYAALPSDDADLETAYSAQDVTDVGTADDTRVNQTATGEFAIHQFKNFVDNKVSATLTWEGQTDFSPVSSTVYLQRVHVSSLSSLSFQVYVPTWLKADEGAVRLYGANTGVSPGFGPSIRKLVIYPS